MNSAWLDLLACPRCGADFRLEETEVENGDIMTGRAVCVACEAIYPIEEGVLQTLPAFLQKEAKDTAFNFGWEWKFFDKVLFSESARMAEDDLFLDFIQPIGKDYFKDKIVMDAGCGMGRFSQLAVKYGAKLVVGVDLSRAVHLANGRLKRSGRFMGIQADLTHLPFKNRFDYIFSLGVIHHTYDPTATFAHLATKVKPKGGMSIWVYGKERNAAIAEIFVPVREKITSKLPKWFLLLCTVPMSLVLMPFVWLSTKFKGMPYGSYFRYLATFSFWEVVFLVFDHVSPRLASYHTREEVADWYRRNAFGEAEVTWRNNNSWRGFAHKTA